MENTNLDTNVIEVELVKADLTDVAIKKMEDSFMGLSIKDVYDKTGYDVVHSALKEAKSFRIAVEKTLKAVRAPAFEFQKIVVAKEKELSERVKKIEAHLKSQEDIYNQEAIPAAVIQTPEEQDADSIVKLRNMIIDIPMPTMFTTSGKAIVDAIRAKLGEALLIK